MDLFDYLTPEKGRGIISNGWKAALITEAICSSINCLEPLDPFQWIEPLSNKNSNTEINIPPNNDVDFFETPNSYEEDDNDDAWIYVNREDDKDVNNIFNIIEAIAEEN